MKTRHDPAKRRGSPRGPHSDGRQVPFRVLGRNQSPANGKGSVSSRSSTHMLMINAQVFVDEWWRNPARDTFVRAAAASAIQCCGVGAETVGTRHAFIRMAEVIRVGDG